MATFTGPDPEGADVIWSTGGTDGDLFTAEGGVLMFKDVSELRGCRRTWRTQPMAQMARSRTTSTRTNANNVYVLKVRATEDVPDGQEEPAKYTEHQIRVTVTNVDEAGMASILVRQPQVGQNTC